MTLTSTEVTIVSSEISNDPRSLGYAEQSHATIVSIMNTSRVSPTPIIVTGAEIMGIVGLIDGVIQPNNAQGVGLTHVLHWLEEPGNDPDEQDHARVARFFFSAAASYDITNNEGRNLIDFMSGVPVADPPNYRQLLSDAVRDALYALGEYRRSVELIGREITEAEVTQALG